MAEVDRLVMVDPTGVIYPEPAATREKWRIVCGSVMLRPNSPTAVIYLRDRGDMSWVFMDNQGWVAPP